MSLLVKLDSFEGSVDLLIKLIEKNKLDIFDIPIALITEQYLAVIEEMQENEMEVMSEFLEMASFLISIKFKMLFPESKESEEEDPREELLEKILEYKKYKLISEDFKKRALEANDMVYREMDIPKEIINHREKPDPKDLLSGIDYNSLYEVFKSLLLRQESRVDKVRANFDRIQIESITIDDAIKNIRRIRKNKKKLSFKKIIDSVETKIEKIVTFLAILELIKFGEIKIRQKELFDDIEISFI